jgi:hypothetical protein
MIPYGYIIFKVTQSFGEILKEEQAGKRTKKFLQPRVSLLGNWWSCQRKRCDYYQIYQAHGPADLTHIGYHAAEKLALDHRATCQTRSERECEVCQQWADSLRGELWEVLMGNKNQISLLEGKREFGFHP